MCRAQDDEADLIVRYQEAREKAKSVGKLDLLERFEKRVEALKSICFNIRFERLLNLLSNGTYINLHDLIRATAPRDYEPEKYHKRLITDLFIFGSNYEQIVFGALNVGNCGLVSYGEYCVILKTDALENRISFLEQNSFRYVDFSQTKLEIEMPEGSRALWHTVSKLCIVKHVERILAANHLDDSQIADIVLHSIGHKPSDDFIEAQILKPISVDNIDRVYRCEEHSTATVEESQIQRQLISSKLAEKGISFEERDTNSTNT
jgi:hypothetical protein